MGEIENVEGVRICGTEEPQYHRLMGFGAWRVAMINHGPKFAAGNLTYVERHRETDEVFVLIEGDATLIIGTELRRIPLRRGIAYDVERNTWHQLETQPGAKLLLVENDDTGPGNSDRLEIREAR